MQNKYLIAIVVSAFLHALYNLIMRRSGRGDLSFVTGMFAIASIIACAVAFAKGDFFDLPWPLIPYIYGAACFYVVYQVFVLKAYQYGEVSSLYPLTVLSPIFIPLWAAILLGERLSPVTVLGIALTVLGAVVVKQHAFSIAEFRNLFRIRGAYKGAGYALGASFFYSFGAVFDKWKISDFPLTVYLSLLLPLMFFNVLSYQVSRARVPFIPYIRRHLGVVCLAGAIVYCSFFTFRIALPEVPVSIAVPVRQVAIVFAIVMGIVALKERFSVSNVIGSLLIMVGIALINMSTSAG